MTTPEARPESLIFPVGHYMGAFHPAVGAPVKYHRVRLGNESIRLETGDEITLWALSHGVPDLAPHVKWTRSKVAELARDSGLVKPENVIDELIEEGVLAEVTPDGPEAEQFARAHRIQPLMIGMGNTVQNPLRFRIGYVDQPVVEVDTTLYELWQWGHLFDLWQVCELFADVARDSSARGAGATDPHRILSGLLSDLHVLLSHSAAYLDLIDDD